LPGLICDRTAWQEQIDALADVADCSVADYGSLDSLSAMAAAVLRSAPERFSVAGHSMGGRVALEIYRLSPNRVARIALFNTGYLPLPPGAAGEAETRNRMELVSLAQSQGMAAMVRQWLPPMIDSRRINDTVLTNAITEMMSRKTPEVFAAHVRALLARPDATPILEQIQCPALLLTGRDDGWSAPAQHALMAAKITGSQLVIVPDCGHMSMMERPVEVSAALRDWLV
jgi:pimeloyl-ACP methyl ester carboxylesterase